MLPELLPFLIQSEGFFQKALATSAGSLSPRTKFKELADYEFLLPPKAEQKRLVELLWAADEVVEKEKREMERMEEYLTSLQTNIFKNDFSNTKKLCDIANITMGQSPAGESYNENKNDKVTLNSPKNTPLQLNMQQCQQKWLTKEIF